MTSYNIDGRCQVPSGISTSTNGDGRPAEIVLENALELRRRGFWPVFIYPSGIKLPRRSEPTKGKEPVGKGWGLTQKTPEELRQLYKWASATCAPPHGCGICLGDGRAPDGGWLIDIEGDGPQAEESYLRLVDGEVITTLGWSSTRAPHRLHTADGGRLLRLLAAAGAVEGKGHQAGKFTLDEFPDLEFRVGRYGDNGEPLQFQSVVPPTPGTDGKPREWNGVETVAELPDAAYANLEAIGELKAKQEEERGTQPAPAPLNGTHHVNGHSRPIKDLIRATTDGPNAEDRARLYARKIDPAISGQRGHDRTFYAACKIGPGFNLPPDVALRVLMEEYNPRCVPPWKESEARHKLNDAYKNEKRKRGYLLDRVDTKTARPSAKEKQERREALLGEGYILDSRGEVQSCAFNTTVWLKNPENGKVVRYDTFNQTITVNGERASDSLYAKLQVEIESSVGRPWGKEGMITGLYALASEDQFSPLKDWLESRQWDGIRRLDAFFEKGFGAPAETDDGRKYLADCARVFFISGVARAYEPGCKADVMPVLIGPQGLGKSEGMADLCPSRDWFTDDMPELTAERSGMALQGKWICEFSETARLQRATSNVAKAWVVRRTDRYRVPWGRADQDFPRQCVFYATSNDDHPLEDTENRRYMPIQATSVDRDWIQANRDQLWAEAVHQYKAGEKWWVIPTSDSGARTKEEQEKARKVDPWEDILRAALPGKNEITVVQAAEELKIPVERFTRREEMRISSCLKCLGFTNKPEKRDEHHRRVWTRPDEISRPKPTSSHPHARGVGITKRVPY